MKKKTSKGRAIENILLHATLNDVRLLTNQLTLLQVQYSKKAGIIHRDSCD